MLGIDVATMGEEDALPALQESRQERVERLIESVNKAKGYKGATSQQRRGERKQKRDDSKIWISANNAYYRCVEQLALLPVIGRFLKQDQIKSQLGEERITKIVKILADTRDQRASLVEQLKALRAQHIEIAKKYPKQQKKFRKQDEILDNMSVMEAYMGWMQSAMEAITLPCAEIMEMMEEIGLDETAIAQAEGDQQSVPMTTKPKPKRVKVKRVKHKHTVSKRK